MRKDVEVKKKILVTGATGTVGTIVREDLASSYNFTLLSRRDVGEPNFLQIDVENDYDALKDAMAGKDAVVHLAYVEEDETTIVNLSMAKNVYRAALETRPHPRLVMASSIHAVGGYLDWDKKQKMITDDHSLFPNGLYGALKCYIETLGRFYASRGLEVVVIRFGGVRTDDRMVDEPGYQSFWLSRRDCAHIVSRAIEADIPRKFVRVFAVSNNAHKVHDISSARELLGYNPQDGDGVTLVL